MGRAHYLKDIRVIVAEANVRAMIARTESPRDRFIIAMLYLTGGRPAEIRLLVRHNFVFQPDHFNVTLHTAKLGKKRGFYIDERTIEVANDSPLADYVLAYVKAFDKPDAALCFVSSDRIRQIVYKASDNEFCPYHFRHSRLTKLARLGATIDELMYFKGATDNRSVSPYIAGKPITRKYKLD